MEINEIHCKTALSKSNLPGLDYSLNPYNGCQHNCVYCYVPNVLRIKRENWGGFVNVKTNIPVVLSKELKRKKSGIVGISTVTDPYQPVEKKYQLTRYCLEQLLRYDFPVCIQTKSELVLRDIDLISKFSNAEVMLSIGTINDNERKILEPYSSSVSERLNVLKQFSNIGIKTSVFFGPIYPTIKIRDLPRIVDIFIEHGVTEIMIDKFNLKPGIQKNIEYILKSNSSLKRAFYDNVFNMQVFFEKVKEEMYMLSRSKNIKIVSAF